MITCIISHLFGQCIRLAEERTQNGAQNHMQGRRESASDLLTTVAGARITLRRTNCSQALCQIVSISWEWVTRVRMHEDQWFHKPEAADRELWCTCPSQDSAL